MNIDKKRLFLITLGFLFAIQSSFAANFFFNSLSNFFGEKGLFGLLQNEYVAASAIYIAMLIGFNTIIKVVLKTIHLFKNSPKEAGAISFMISFMGTTGIFFMYKGSPEEIILLFGGTIGFFLMSIVFGSILLGLNAMLNASGMKSFKSGGWYFYMGLATFIVASVMSNMFARVAMKITGMSEYLQVITDSLGTIGVIAMLAGLAFFLGKKRKEKNLEVENFNKEHPEVAKAKLIFNNLNKDLVELENLGKNLIGRMR